jgi:hypothetical protein
MNNNIKETRIVVIIFSIMCYVLCGIDFIISISIRNYFGSNLCRPFALGLWIFYRGRPPRIMARLAFLNELVNMPDVLPLASGGFLELDNGRRSGSR